MAINVRKGQGDVKLTREEFERRLRERFFDPRVSRPSSVRSLTSSMSHGRCTTSTTRARASGSRTRFRRSGVRASRSNGSRHASEFREAEREQKRCEPSRPRPARVRRGAPRSDMSGRNVEDVPARVQARDDDRARRLSLRLARPRVFSRRSTAARFFRARRASPRRCRSATGRVRAIRITPWARSVDWMNELYPRWVAAHGVMIITPVYWYQAPSVLKLMIDRLVCADGGNPDQTTTHGKNVEEAKALELAGWSYPRHLAGRVFAVVVHGDTVGAETLRRSLSDWLTRHEAVARRAAGRDRSLHRLLRAVRHQPRSARQGSPRCSRRSAILPGPSSTRSRWSRGRAIPASRRGTIRGPK